MFASMLDTDYARKPVFIKNFWEGFQKVLSIEHRKLITDYSKCDFTPIHNWTIAERERKKAIPQSDRKHAKEFEARKLEKYNWAIIDGKAEKVGNYRVEPPGLFRGRGEHPKMGRVKRRIIPEDIIINIGREATPPEPPPGHKWKAVIHNQKVSWLAGWKDSINEKDWKYVQLGATSSLKGDSDLAKYEKARKLHLHIDTIRANYRRNFDSPDMMVRQLACTVYLIDKLALRAGGEKDEDLADTVGVCTLRVGHLSMLAPRTVKFDFLGKDSIRYQQEHDLEEAAFRCLRTFCESKQADEDVFHLIDPERVNKHLKTLMEGLTIKVFRTYNASITLNRLLEDQDSHTDSLVKKSHYDAANKEVAILCNHQKGVSKGHNQAVENSQAKVDSLRKEIEALREDDSDKIQSKLISLQERLTKAELRLRMKDDLKTVSLGTSKINYLDPRITIAWCKRNECPLNIVYTKALIEKFNWAMDCSPFFDFAAQ